MMYTSYWSPKAIGYLVLKTIGYQYFVKKIFYYIKNSSW